MALTHYNKTVLVGNEGAGKTSLIYRTQYGEFSYSTTSTIGATYVKHYVNVDDKEIKIHIWDTAGQPRFSSLLPMFIKGAKIVLICFDRPDVSIVQKHEREIHDIDSLVRIILVMTKVDRRSRGDQREAIKEYAQSRDLSVFFTSSLTGEGIQELFNEIARHFISLLDTESISDDDIFDLENSPARLENSPAILSQCCVTM